MGRSVSYMTAAAVVLYFSPEITGNNEEGQYDEEQFQMDHDDMKENLIAAIQAKYKSFREIGKADARQFTYDRECWPILYNYLVVIYLSEYCGLYSLSIVPNNQARSNGYYYDNIESLSKNFAGQISKGIDKILDECGARPLTKIGSFSNGEGVYEKKKIG